MSDQKRHSITEGDNYDLNSELLIWGMYLAFVYLSFSCAEETARVSVLYDCCEHLKGLPLAQSLATSKHSACGICSSVCTVWPRPVIPSMWEAGAGRP